ncbi:6-hydroxymethylpterin diphosphokinase MptE-like protein [Glaciecola siphonariae]|uniref:6-hydroxymethylpterin diphosphokinase MptE-like protein n=1 Tax=Glaciecola siphonariae TaxID=521012 RepID=A0ABV9LTV5_9ALTE
MQNDIRLHLADDEEKQNEIEAAHAASLQARFDLNLAAFLRHIPSIGEKLQHTPLKQYSIFLDKHSQTNIVEIRTGTTFYHFDVDKEIRQQVQQISCHSALVNYKAGQNSGTPVSGFDEFLKYSTHLSEKLERACPDTLVVFGIGKGTHIEHLFDTQKAQNIVIYEPNWELFYCSLFCTDWHLILDEAARASRRLFLQIEQNAATLHADLKELADAFDIKQILFFKHYNEASFDHVINELRSGRHAVLMHPSAAQFESDFKQWVPPWTPSFDVSAYACASKQSERFKNNIQAFTKYFPALATTFSEYQCQAWEPIVHMKTGCVALFHKRSCTVFSIEDTKRHGREMFAHFAKYPNQDGLIFGCESVKLKHYMHNIFIRRANTVLTHQKDEKGELPANIKSLIMFGLDTGYAFEAFTEKTEVANLFVCEPNPDFFFASLFAIDWLYLLEHIDKTERRIYLNIGEASSNLYADINSQFLAAGPHLLADTYFYQGYDNALLSRIIKDLRDQLRITFSLSENLDHALYGIAHTQYALEHKVPAMAANASGHITKRTRGLPLFIVGNGPSLDDTIEVLKAHREQVLVVSCGTALQALHRYGITPDFHAEVEQCRATFDWASRIADPAYLKAITLVSVNGIHPDTCALYKDTLFAFKQGESSAMSALSILGKERFATLNKAYPTVTNLAVNFFLELGFTNLYLLGVDLGFVDYTKHHSQQSGYFENGKQIYNYQENLAKSLPVKGNFRPQVYTKAEFNISRMMLEQALAQYKADCFNMSDGAYVSSSTPLHADEVLIINKPIDREEVIVDIKNGFVVVQANIRDLYKSAFSQTILNDEMDKLSAICSAEFCNKEDIESLIEAAGELIDDNIIKGRSLFIYYFYGSLNYLRATLSKALMSSDEEQALEVASNILRYWNRLLNDAKLMLNHNGWLLDTSTSFAEKREMLMLSSDTVTFTAFDARLAAYITNSEYAQFEHLLEFSMPSECEKHCVFLTEVCDVDRVVASLSSGANSRLTESGTQERMLFVYTDARLYKTIDNKLKHLLPVNAALMYVPFWLSASQQQTSEDTRMPLTALDDALHFLLARIDDALRFTHIVFRARFDEAGLIHAYANKKDEYNCEAVDYLAACFEPALTSTQAYSFFRYIAYIETDEPEPTLLDALGNRGLHIPRDIQAYELLGVWYKSSQAEQIRSDLQEHINSV